MVVPPWEADVTVNRRGVSGDTLLIAGAESDPDDTPPDNTPMLSVPNDNLVWGVANVAGSSLSSGTTGVDVDISVADEKEFFTNKRWCPWDTLLPPIEELGPPIGKYLPPNLPPKGTSSSNE